MTPQELSARARQLLRRGAGDGRTRFFAAPLESRALCVGAFDALPSSASASVPACLSAAGGATMFAGQGIVALVMVLPRAGVAPDRLINRASRPLLHFLRSMNAPASYYGRDALTLPSGEPVRFLLTGTAGAFLLEARFAVHASLDPQGWPLPVHRRPGDRRPSIALVDVSRQVPRDTEAFAQALAIALAPYGERDNEPAQADGRAPPIVDESLVALAAPIGVLRASETGHIYGPFFASEGLTDSIAASVASGVAEGEAVSQALAKEGAFVVGADPEHLVAALLGRAR